MKHIHFYGCSFTAGDELADDIFFPWKKDCATTEEYYQRRNKDFVTNQAPLPEYINACRDLAYPAKIKLPDVITHNHAFFGASVKHCVYEIIKTVESGERIDAIFLQIPPFPRELHINKREVSSVQITSIGIAEEAALNRYKESKVVSHDMINWATEDVLDIITVDGFVKNLGIPFYLITLGSKFYQRVRMVRMRRLLKLDNILDAVNVIDFDKKYTEIYPAHVTLGLHFDESVHFEVADRLRLEIEKL